jgi:hypothetical protein
MAYPDFLIDKRVLQRNIDKSVVDAGQYDKLLTSLPDRADNVAPAAVEEEEDFDEDEDEDEAEENE